MAKTLKAYFRGAAAALVLVLTPAGTASASGFPVFDATAWIDLVQNEGRHAKNVADALAQLQQLQETYSQLRDQYDSITGIRFEALLDGGALGEQQRQKLARVYRRTDQALGLGLPDASDDIRNFDLEFGLDSLDDIFTPGTANYEIERKRRHASAIALKRSGEVNEEMQEIVERLAILHQSTTRSRDLKDEQTIQNQTKIYELRLQAEKMSMDMAHLNLLAQQRSAQLQQEDRIRRMFMTNSTTP